MLAIRRQLNKAINEKDATQIKVMLQYHRLKIDFEHRSEEGTTLLHECCEKGCLDIVRLLVEQGACIETPDLKGNTSLHYSCLYGHISITRYLILNCGSLYSRNHAGLLPIDVCSNPDLKFLVEMAMNIDTLGGNCMTIGRIRPRKVNISARVNANDQLTVNSGDQETTKEKKYEGVKIKKSLEHEATDQENNESSRDKKQKTSSTIKNKESLKLKEPLRVPKLNAKSSLKTNSDIKKSSSEADIQCLNKEASLVTCIKKVKNTDHINLVGLSIK